MKKVLFLLFILFSFLSVEAKMFQTVSLDKATIYNSTEKPWCKSCGMDLGMFYKTNHAIKIKSGKILQLCSLHCLVENLEKNKIKGSITVVDNSTLKFIPVKSAFYVVGSKIKGTMSKSSKYAFGTDKAAKEFMNKNGGSVVHFDKAYSLAKNDFANDMKMISMKKKKKVFPMGKKIASKMCDQDKLKKLHAHTITDLKFEIKKHKICGKLQEKQLQMLAVFLIMNKSGHTNMVDQIKVPASAKCPICGMFVAKYPKWVAVMETSKGKFYFDGAKDFFKYFFLGNSGTSFVTGYYDLKKLNAKKAYYVIGSNVLGPMGNELIPFSTRIQAKSFLKDHKGKEILTFNEVTTKLIHSLDQ